MDFDRWFSNQGKSAPSTPRVESRRMVKQLTELAQFDRDDFERNDSEYGRLSDRGCSCFNSAPCSFCIHPGNPFNQECDDEAWELVSEDDVQRDTLE